jgi:hypothetical protein
VTNVDLRDLLRVHCAWQEPTNTGRQAVPRPERVQRTRVIHAWAVQSPRRAAEMGMRSSFGRPDLASRSVGGAAATADPPSAVHRKETERIARALAERARRERADAARPRSAAGETGETGENRVPENGASENGRAGTGAVNGPGWPSRPVSTWYWPGVLAVVESAMASAPLAPASAPPPVTSAINGEGRAEPESGLVPIQMEGDGPLVLREKVHAARPMTIDQALLEMELVGHDFYLFHDRECDRFSVVYRRRGYDYGVIRLVEE